MGILKRLTRIVRSNLNSLGIVKENTISQDFTNSEKSNNYTQQEHSHNNIESEFYANLELPYGASFEEIKNAYKRLLKKYHPDHYSNNKQKQLYANEITKKLNEAFNYFENKEN